MGQHWKLGQTQTNIHQPPSRGGTDGQTSCSKPTNGPARLPLHLFSQELPRPRQAVMRRQRLSPNSRQSGPVSGCLAPLGEYYWMISPQSAPTEYGLANNPLGTLMFLAPHDGNAARQSQPSTQLEVLHF